MEKIQKTFENMTHHAIDIVLDPHTHQSHKPPFLAHNVKRRNKAVATNMACGDEPAVDDGSTLAQVFVGLKSKCIQIYGMKSSKEFPLRLMDCMRELGAMDKLISNSAKNKISQCALDVPRGLCIDDSQTEPNYQHQNPESC